MIQTNFKISITNAMLDEKCRIIFFFLKQNSSLMKNELSTIVH